MKKKYVNKKKKSRMIYQDRVQAALLLLPNEVSRRQEVAECIAKHVATGKYTRLTPKMVDVVAKHLDIDLEPFTSTREARATKNRMNHAAMIAEGKRLLEESASHERLRQWYDKAVDAGITRDDPVFLGVAMKLDLDMQYKKIMEAPTLQKSLDLTIRMYQLTKDELSPYISRASVDDRIDRSLLRLYENQQCLQLLNVPLVKRLVEHGRITPQSALETIKERYHNENYRDELLKVLQKLNAKNENVAQYLITRGEEIFNGVDSTFENIAEWCKQYLDTKEKQRTSQLKEMYENISMLQMIDRMINAGKSSAKDLLEYVDQVADIAPAFAKDRKKKIMKKKSPPPPPPKQDDSDTEVEE
jgi:hypothetical protein